LKCRSSSLELRYLFDKEIPAMSRSLFLSAALATAAVFGPGTIPGGLGARPAMAQSSVWAELYGQGVHAYFAHDYFRAHELLTQAIDGGMNDPRAYYFRGLALGATGRIEDAEDDFRAGAALEARSTMGPLVARALTRVQGTTRLQIEQVRTKGRLDAAAEMGAAAEQRYSAQQQAEGAVLSAPPKPRPPVPMPGRPVVPPAAAEPTPFENDAMATGQPRVETADVLEDAMVDPFADDAAPAATPGAPAVGAPDPFGGGPPVVDDPFGAPPAGDADPFGADPFGS